MAKENETVREIPVNLLEINPQNPRLIFDQEKLDRLLESVKDRRILVPLNVFIDDNKKYIIIDGERRYKVALQLGLTKLPVIINERPQSEGYVQDMFHIHNLREPWELVPTAIKLNEVIETFSKKQGHKPTERELNKLTGLTISEIRRCRLILTFPEKIQDLMLQDEAKTSKEKSIIGKDKLLTEDFFIEMAKNIITPLEKNNPKAFREIGGSKKIFEAIIEKRKGGLIKNIVSLRPLSKYIRDRPIKGGQAIRNFVQNRNLSSEDLISKVGLVFDLYKFERNMNVFYGAVDNIPKDLDIKEKENIAKILKRMKNFIEKKLKELR